MKLLLTSNGFINTTIEKDFLDLINNRTNLKVAIIPTAGDPIEWVPLKEGDDSYDNFVPKLVGQSNDGKGEYYDYFKNKGCDVIIVDLKDDTNAIQEKLQNADIIFVGGGDVNYLLDWAKKARLDTYLKDILNKDVLYIGLSAGNGLLMPDIGLTWWEPTMKADHAGFGIVDFDIVVHQKEDDQLKNTEKLIERKKYYQTVTKYPWKTYLVKDGQAIKVIGDAVEHIGEGEKKSI
ncbi:Type 1 glutamine amidotransferase-like domain-containing protein [Patescibacteria group bacterium]|nr:Type 1 glutamine amidotransferase-like domain-containing protein [Patescibacteria group bacterium]